MGTFTQRFDISIGGKTRKKGDKYEYFSFENIVLRQELLRPNELRFTMYTNEKEKDIDEVESFDVDIFRNPRELMGEKIECVIETLRFKRNEEIEDVTEFLTFKGIIFDVNIYSQGNMFSKQYIDVTAYSSDYLLMDHPHCCSYENMTLKEIVEKTIEPYQDEMRNAQIDPLHETNKKEEDKDTKWEQQIPYTVQHNETNYQFLIRLAQRYGQWMYHDGEKWVFGKIQRKKSIDLHAGNDIENYHYTTKILHHKVKQMHDNYLDLMTPFYKSSSEVSDLETPGYDVLTDTVKKKAAELYKKETLHNLLCSTPEGEGAKPGNEIDELDIALKAKLYSEKTQQVVCSSSTVRADLSIGSRIKILKRLLKDVDTDFDTEYGDLLITGITHYTQEHGEYRNSITAVPSKSDYPPYYQTDIFPVSSAQRAIVWDNKDPELLGRVRVKFLWQTGTELLSPWIRIAQPHGGHNKGFYFIPEFGEDVIVDFENGNAEKPYVVGTVYNVFQESPTKEKYIENNEAKMIRTRNGHEILFWDKAEGKGGIQIKDWPEENCIIQLDTDRKTITIQAKGDVYVNAGGNIAMNAGKNITMKAGGEIDIEAEGLYTLQAGQIDNISRSSFAAVAKSTAFLRGNSGLTATTDGSANVTAGDTMVVGGSTTIITGAVSMGGGGQSAVVIQGSSVSIQ